MAQFRKKPVVIEAMEFRGPVWQGDAAINYMVLFDDWLSSKVTDAPVKYRGAELVVSTLEGEMTASPGDWIICGVKGELYPCKPDIFAATYEAVESSGSQLADANSKKESPNP